MTIDERLERLVERHEALAQMVELLAIETRELRAAIADVHAEQEKDPEHIHALVRIAEIHERRLSDLEGSE
ncbi:MAG TPA: hypothetical protein VMG40_01350 [Bryobacteraceae bacterium]|nr:hypothetical protein [Bryobacteraceae bacterium]